MLLFISNGGHTRNLPHQFQYISCYSLSDFEGLGQSVQSTFQYISCYSLSPLVRSWEMQPRSFQYISCYSLSNCAAISPGCLIVSIHLMLLFIVAYQTCKRLRHGVSIHLMLLFIEGTLELELEDDAFQYISCYSLSHSGNRTEDYSGVSIHLMLLFIGKELGYGSSGMWVSIHLMLLFIISKQRNRTCEILFQYISCYSLSEMHRVDRKLSRGFNTSHVTLYLRGGGSLWTFSVVSIHLMLLFIRLQDI